MCVSECFTDCEFVCIRNLKFLIRLSARRTARRLNQLAVQMVWNGQCQSFEISLGSDFWVCVKQKALWIVSYHVRLIDR